MLRTTVVPEGEGQIIGTSSGQQTNNASSKYQKQLLEQFLYL